VLFTRCYDDQIKEDEMDGACGAHEEIRNAYKILVGKPEGWRPLGRWEHIEMYVMEMGSEGVDWIHLAQDWGRWRALVNTIMNLRVP
jgi:hypothetical protein